jgi:hypothetical protein
VNGAAHTSVKRHGGVLSVAQGLGPERLAAYTRIVLMAAPDEPSRRALEALMATVFKNEFLDTLQAEAEARGSARGEARGEAAGRAQMILQVLAARNIAVPTEIRDQVLACTDIGQLDAWGSKAAVAPSVEEIFGAASDVR